MLLLLLAFAASGILNCFRGDEVKEDDNTSGQHAIVYA
jgi:hypothetical protein